jgi:hypothetical protein
MPENGEASDVQLIGNLTSIIGRRCHRRAGVGS